MNAPFTPRIKPSLVTLHRRLMEAKSAINAAPAGIDGETFGALEAAEGDAEGAFFAELLTVTGLDDSQIKAVVL